MNTRESPQKAQSKKPKLYFAIAAVMLFAMAFLWSLDSSFVYIFLGTTVFFVFMALWNSPKNADQPPFSGGSTYKQGKSQKDALDELKDLFTTRKSFQQPKNPSVAAPNKIIFVVFIFVFFIFFTIVILAVFSDDDDATSDAFDYYSQAEQFRWSNNYDSAILYYQRALAVDPDHVEALNGYANVLLQQQQYDSARGVFSRVLEINPDDSQARYNKALTYQYQKEFSQSLHEAFQLMKDNPDYYDAMVLAGDDYYMQQHYDSALYWYEDAYGKGVKSPWLCHVMGYLHDTKGNTDKAVTLYREALSMDSTKTEIYTRLIELYPGQEGEAYRKKLAELKKEGY
jgi:tetratricopeptide (TPR) repeat protein